MKQNLITLALVFALSTLCTDAQPRHRHHAVAATDTVAAAVAEAAADDEGIEAYSDTTSTASDALDEDQAVTSVTTVSHNPDDYDDVVSWLQSFTFESLGVMGSIFAVLIAILAIAVVLLVLLAPLIVVILVLRYLVREHNDRVTLAEKAMETGQPIPEELIPVDKQSDEYLRRRGIRNIWIGIGMAMMFGIWGADMLTGIGVLVLCYGIGQFLIARSSMKRNQQNDSLK